jgi:hypothetical protein
MPIPFEYVKRGTLMFNFIFPARLYLDTKSGFSTPELSAVFRYLPEFTPEKIAVGVPSVSYFEPMAAELYLWWFELLKAVSPFGCLKWIFK